MANKEIEQAAKEAADKWVFDTNGNKWSNNNDEAGDNFNSYREGYIAGASSQRSSGSGGRWVKASEERPVNNGRKELFFRVNTKDGLRRYSGWFGPAYDNKHYSFFTEVLQFEEEYFDLIEWLDESESQPLPDAVLTEIIEFDEWRGDNNISFSNYDGCYINENGFVAKDIQQLYSLFKGTTEKPGEDQDDSDEAFTNVPVRIHDKTEQWLKQHYKLTRK